MSMPLEGGSAPPSTSPRPPLCDHRWCRRSVAASRGLPPLVRQLAGCLGACRWHDTAGPIVRLCVSLYMATETNATLRKKGQLPLFVTRIPLELCAKTSGSRARRHRLVETGHFNRHNPVCPADTYFREKPHTRSRSHHVTDLLEPPQEKPGKPLTTPVSIVR